MSKKQLKTGPYPKTLGPVSDLERHLQPDWWRTLFNSFYLKTDGDVVENDQNTRADIDAVIQVADIHSNSAICDLCCGQGRHSLEITSRGYTDVTGIDRSRYLIQLAKKRAAARGLAVSFHEGDARKFGRPGKNFDAVLMMGNSFGYFEQPSDDIQVLKRVASNLNPDGILLLDLVDGQWMRENFEKRSWEWIDQNHFVCRERALSADQSRIVSREVITHAEKGVLADQFYAERLYSREELKDLLNSLEYRDIQFHDTLQTNSERNQDLGMMARRILITVRAPIKTQRVKARPPQESVLVLMGDSSLPDKVKNNGVFNDEDHRTVRRLKDTLAELTDYRFTYIERHRNLIDTLKNNPPRFVLNLCDEGYLNDPLKELHIVALLEMLGVPYTGAGPACLAHCYNKFFVAAIARELEIPTPRETWIGTDENAATIPTTFPALIKPTQGDGSMGITQQAVVHNASELLSYLKWVREKFGRISLLVQEFLSGPEYSIGVIGNPGLGFHFLPIMEVDYSGLPPELPKILGFESKWVPNSDYWDKIRYRAADLPEETTRLLQDYATMLFSRNGMRDYARFDFRTDDAGVIKLLEINPNPGWCWDGKLNMMAEWGGWSYGQLLERIIKAAEERLGLELQESEATRSANDN